MKCFPESISFHSSPIYIVLHFTIYEQWEWYRSWYIFCKIDQTYSELSLLLLYATLYVTLFHVSVLLKFNIGLIHVVWRHFLLSFFFKNEVDTELFVKDLNDSFVWWGYWNWLLPLKLKLCLYVIIIQIKYWTIWRLFCIIEEETTQQFSLKLHSISLPRAIWEKINMEFRIWSELQ